MLLHCILLDAHMPVTAVLARLARYGIWLNPAQPDAKAWIMEQAALLEADFEQMARHLSEPNPARYGAAIRRQWNQNVLWYARSIHDVLLSCATASRDSRLMNVLGLRESDSRPSLVYSPRGSYPDDGVVVHDGRPVAVNFVTAADRAGISFRSFEPAVDVPTTSRSAASGRLGAAERSPSISAWPRVDAPGYVAAGVEFSIKVGFGGAQQRGVAGSRITLPVSGDQPTIDVTIDLLATGLDAPGGWSRPLSVPVADPLSAEVAFTLVGREPPAPSTVHLTSLEVRYVVKGTVCGTASTNLVVGPSAGRPSAPADIGTPWLSHPPTSSGGSFDADPHAPDLTIELAKPDKNPAEGQYVCKLYSVHQLQTPMGPWEVQLGQDAKTFARTVIHGVRQHSGNALLNNFIRSVGRLVTEKLPAEVFDAIHEVASLVRPEPPAILFVSAEPYVPWELAFMDTPLDQSRPPFLGSQTVVGRWFRDPKAAPTPSTSAPAQKPHRPPPHPPSGIPVSVMAALAGNYKPLSGLKSLPAADAEVRSLEKNFGALLLLASPEQLVQVLEARLVKGIDTLGPAGAVHFAGHGQFDPTEPDSSVLYLTDGTPLSSLLFRDARYYHPNQPIIFFNACMIGLGGEVLGDMGGFPGNCLRGGFGAVLGALWEVDDVVANQIALEFWQRALPPTGQPSEPVAAVLRDLRARYAGQPPVHTYLAYTYWGHPRLRLTRES